MTKRTDYVLTAILMAASIAWTIGACDKSPFRERSIVGTMAQDQPTVSDDWVWRRTSRVEGGADARVKP